jgi:hypothetical protein
MTQNEAGARQRGFRVCDERVATYGTGRLCSVEGCSTRLSRYNPSTACAVHWRFAPEAVEILERPRQRRGAEEIVGICSYEGCRAEFRTFNRARKYCSDACRMKAFQMRAKAAFGASGLEASARAA